MSRQQLLPFAELLRALLELCNEGRSGSMYTMTDNAEGAVFTLHDGKIVDILYRNASGADALPLIKEIKMAKFFFNSGAGLLTAAPGKDKALPSNKEIFQKLGLQYSITPPAAAPANGNAKQTLKKILAVEDSALARKVLVQTLVKSGYTVVEARNGLEALDKLGNELPDLVLLDLILPQMDGYQVLSAMKKHEFYKDIPVIVLTSRDTLFDKLKGKMSGTDEYLTKPIDPGKLLSKVEKYLG